MVSAQARRQMVDYAVSRGASVRRACALLRVSRSSLGYRSRMAERDAELIGQLEEIAARHHSYGYRFAWALLRRLGQRINRKRVHRVWRWCGFSVRRRRKRKKIRTGKPRVLTPMGPNQVWAYDFVHDRCGNGQALKALTVVDEWTRECLALEVGTSMGAAKVVEVLKGLFTEYGVPQTLRSDNGPEFIARALRIWVLLSGSEVVTIEPGKPWQNGSVESFHNTLRRECLNAEWFANPREARIVLQQYRWEYNTQRPHSSLGYRTPAEVAAESRTVMTQKSGEEEIEFLERFSNADPGRIVAQTLVAGGQSLS